MALAANAKALAAALLLVLGSFSALAGTHPSPPAPPSAPASDPRSD